MGYTVYCESNYGTGDRYRVGEFADIRAAKAKCREIVDDFLTENCQPGMDAEALLAAYKLFGEDPFIDGGGFSGWSYAEQRARELCSG